MDRCRQLANITAYCQGLARAALPAEVYHLPPDDQLKLYEHLEQLAIEARNATHRLARHLHSERQDRRGAPGPG